jgi:hypothetical protein
MGWQSSFVAMGLAVGEPLEGLIGSLDENEVARLAPLLTALRSDSREVRARAMAEPLAAIVEDALALEVVWPA